MSEFGKPEPDGPPTQVARTCPRGCCAYMDGSQRWLFPSPVAVFSDIRPAPAFYHVKACPLSDPPVALGRNDAGKPIVTRLVPESGVP